MNDLGWRADGIERTRAAGGVELELRRQAGFTAAGLVVRRSQAEAGGAGIPLDAVDYYPEDPDPEAFLRRRRR